MNFSNINPSVSYKNYEPYSTSDNPSFKMYENLPKGYKTSEYYENGYSTLTSKGNIIEETELSKMFFSNENIARVQKKIKVAVYNKTKGKYKLVEDQDETDLYLLMRSVYLENAKHLKSHLVRQVKILNETVIKESVPGIITNIKQYYSYIDDINKPIQPIDRPMNINSAGRKTLPSVTTIIGMK